MPTSRRALCRRTAPLALAALLAMSGLAVAAGCGGEAEARPGIGHHSMADASEHSYRFARSSEGNQVMEQIPCYCGCRAMVPEHKNLLDCFRGDHATGCKVCLDEAHDAQRMLDEGRTVAEIRTAIDARYGDAGPPTATPPVAS